MTLRLSKQAKEIERLTKALQAAKHDRAEALRSGRTKKFHDAQQAITEKINALRAYGVDISHEEE